jgi:hypothetical protein
MTHFLMTHNLHLATKSYAWFYFRIEFGNFLVDDKILSVFHWIKENHFNKIAMVLVGDDPDEFSAKHNFLDFRILWTRIDTFKKVLSRVMRWHHFPPTNVQNYKP